MYKINKQIKLWLPNTIRNSFVLALLGEANGYTYTKNHIEKYLFTSRDFMPCKSAHPKIDPA